MPKELIKHISIIFITFKVNGIKKLSEVKKYSSTVKGKRSK